MATGKSNELEGQVAIVTGAARNIGKAIALDLVDAGAKVCINVKTSVDAAEEARAEIEALGGKAMVVQADVTDPGEVARMVDQVVGQWGRVDILVHNAAIRLRTAITDMSLDEWHQVTAIILDGAFLCSKAVIPHMRKQGGGTIISMGGLTAHMGASQRVHVTTAKSGLVGFTKGLATELGAEGIGLCRTEHMFFGPDREELVRDMFIAAARAPPPASPPTARPERALDGLGELQRQDFAEIFRVMRGLPVTIRLLDPPMHEFVSAESFAASRISTTVRFSSREERLSGPGSTAPRTTAAR